MNSQQKLHPQFKLQVYEDRIVMSTVFYRDSVLEYTTSVQCFSYLCQPSKSAVAQSPETMGISKAHLVVMLGSYKLVFQIVQNSQK